MRHNRQTHRLNRNPKERQAMLENLVSSLLHHQQITTTLPKAKAAQRLAEKVITLGKADTLHARRRAFSYLQDRTLISKLFKEVAPRYKTRNGGYTRIMHLSRRKGDGAELALLELTEKEIIIKEPKKTKKQKPDKGHTHDAGHKPAEPPKTPKAKTPEKGPEPKKKGGFFGNISRFFRNKGGS